MSYTDVTYTNMVLSDYYYCSVRTSESSLRPITHCQNLKIAENDLGMILHILCLDPRGKALETRVLNLLENDTYAWDELLEAVTDDVESRLDDALEQLQAENRIRYSGRHGGYTIVEDDGD